MASNKDSSPCLIRKDKCNGWYSLFYYDSTDRAYLQCFTLQDMHTEASLDYAIQLCEEVSPDDPEALELLNWYNGFCFSHGQSGFHMVQTLTELLTVG